MGGTIARSLGGIEWAIFWKAEGRSGSGDRKVAVKGAAMHGVRAQGDHRVEVAEHRETKDGVDSDV